jgi:hypothetical protein
MLTVLVKTRYEVTCTIVSRSPKGSANITVYAGFGNIMDHEVIHPLLL